MKILSWNVNGIRAVQKKGFLDWLRKESPDILCLQETKAFPDQLDEELLNPSGIYIILEQSRKKRICRSSRLYKNKPENVEMDFGPESFNTEGRALILHYKDFILINCYYPNGGRGPVRLKYKLDFYDAFLEYVDSLKSRKLIICGDVNTAHKALDLARPKQNEMVSGFLPEERAWVDKFVSHGYVDTFRQFNSEGDNYSWWDYKTRSRERNVGWRIDYFFVTEKILPNLRKAFIMTDVMGSGPLPGRNRVKMKEYPKLLIADKDGNIFDVPFLEGVGMKCGEYSRLNTKDLVKLHPDSELFMLPDRKPVAFDPVQGDLVQVETNPIVSGDEPCYAVSAFPAPGFTVTHNAAYLAKAKQKMMPLFSYAAVVLYKDEFYTAAYKVDSEKRQELSGMPQKQIEKNANRFRKLFPGNRLVKHLEGCALCYGCPAAKNFFLSRYECPLPTSPGCNARCIGCISYQPGTGCPVTQPRITFVPSPREVAEVALYHISKVQDPVVSFGQGCEGEPLIAGKTLVEAVRLIRKETNKGMINLNTNASKPDLIKELFKEGLNSIRVSMNSVREEFYNAYYRRRIMVLRM